MFAGKKVHDPCAEVKNVKMELAQSLQKLSIGHPGKVGTSFFLDPEINSHATLYILLHHERPLSYNPLTANGDFAQKKFF